MKPYTHDKSIFGKRLEELRKAVNLTQKQLGEKSGLSATWICHIERGRRTPNVEHLVGLACALGVSIGKLISLPASREGIKRAKKGEGK